MKSAVFFYPVQIKESDLDVFGHVNNATYLVLFEKARWDLVTKNGYGLEKIKETGLGPTILEINLVFSRELRLNDNIVIETTLLSYEKKIGRLSQKMLRNGVVCCEATLVIALFDLKERKLVVPTREWLSAMGFSLSES